MYKPTINLSWRATLLFVALGLYAISSACGPEYPDSGAVAEPDSEPVATPPDVEPGSETITLEVSLPYYAPGQNIPESVFEDFMAMNPDIQVQYLYIPQSDYIPSLKTGYMAGVRPDIVVLTYNSVADFQLNELLIPLGEPDQYIGDGFLPDAIRSTTFEGATFGLPWLRSACSPNYQSLAVLEQEGAPTSQYEAAFRLLEYLTQPEVQMSNFLNAGWYPTIEITYMEAALSCEPVNAFRLTPIEVSHTVAQVQESLYLLENVVPVGLINSFDATAVFEGEQSLGQAAPVFNDQAEDIIREVLAGEGLLIGTLFVDQPVEDYPVGEFAVMCQGNEQEGVMCFLVGPDGSEFPVVPETFERTAAPVGQPSCVVEEGSRKFCWYVDGLKFCIRYG